MKQMNYSCVFIRTSPRYSRVVVSQSYGHDAMSDEQLRAQRYRKRAQDFRAIAELDRKAPNHGALLEIARRYDQMAHRLEAGDLRRRGAKKIA